ncbi:MAG: hypothetical protein ABI286_03945 [Edaphobacter sp.]
MQSIVIRLFIVIGGHRHFFFLVIGFKATVHIVMLVFIAIVVIVVC